MNIQSTLLPLSFQKIKGLFKIEDLKIKFSRFEELKTYHYFVICDHRNLLFKTEDLKTAHLKSEDSKFGFMCWEPLCTELRETGLQHKA